MLGGSHVHFRPETRRSARLIKDETGMPKACATLINVLSVGLFVARSNCLI